ncbi:MAG: helix-turn-helix transcriptional regulator [Firmicutes bacterium]|nr:helix-turn-helix transcriptional regulator [Bacillota bacterium]
MGERIRAVRGEASQAAFAQALGFSQGYIADVERGRTKPSIELLRAINVKYNASIEWIITGKEHAPRDSRNISSEDEACFATVLDTLWHMYKTADDKTRAWIEIQLRRAIPELGELTDAQKKQHGAAAESA